jgi:hypothetical protein
MRRSLAAVRSIDVSLLGGLSAGAPTLLIIPTLCRKGITTFNSAVYNIVQNNIIIHILTRFDWSDKKCQKISHMSDNCLSHARAADNIVCIHIIIHHLPQ